MRNNASYNTSGIARKLRGLRKEFGDTKTRMAGRLGVKVNAYYKYERGESVPGFAALERMMNELHISMDWFLFGVGPRSIPDKTDTDALHQKIKNLETDLENERENNETLTEEISEYGEVFDELDKPGVMDMLKYMDEDPSFYFKVMLFYQEYREQNKKPQNSPSRKDTKKNAKKKG